MLRRRLPPVTRVALAFATGAALPQYGVPVLGWALLLLSALLLPVGPFRRPTTPTPATRSTSWGPGSGTLHLCLLALAAGILHGEVEGRRLMADCRWRLPEGPLVVTADVIRSDGPRRVRVRSAAPCEAVLRVRLPPSEPDEAGADDAVAPGVRIRLTGVWRPWRLREAGVDPLWAGEVLADSVTVLGSGSGVAAWMHRHRDGLARIVDARFTREAPLVQALVLARRGELPRDTRDAFVRAGTAHLLAISGFHVGLLAALAIWGVGRVASRRSATAAGALLAWAYVLLLGLPDAATRAAVLLTLVASGRMLGRPVVAAGALGTALLVLTVADPGVAGRVGAQLSFAGALGLAVAATPVAREMRRWLPPGNPDRVGGLRRATLDALAAAFVATLATLPLVAWHFERVSLVSVPATLAATPLVALALPTVVATLVLDLVPVPGSDLLAVPLALAAEGLLGITRVIVGLCARPEWASVPVGRNAVVAALAGTGVAALILRDASGVGGAVRGAVVGLAITGAVVAAPVVAARGDGDLVLHVLDAGQGDALALRTPGGHWLVVDGGPPPGESVARALARLGVRRIDLLVLTHPDADHVGGVPTLLRRFEVTRVVGPGSVRPAGPWTTAVDDARRRGVPWGIVVRGDTWHLDGVAFSVLHPEPTPGPVVAADPNARSVVLLAAWQGVEILLTGDAPEEVEAGIAAAVGDIDILKVGHHGSRTSTGSALLERTRPEVALIPVGRGNRYGHPHPVVLRRLEAQGAEVWRTDRDGALTVRIDAGGGVHVEAAVGDAGAIRGNSDGERTKSRR